MAHLVIDAGVGLKWFLDEDQSEEARSVLHENASFHVPQLFYVETSAVLTKKVRRNELRKQEAVSIYDTLSAFPFDETSNELLLDQAFDLSLLHQVTVYDALYIVLAIAVEGKMVTTDKRFRQRTEQVGLSEWVKLV